MSGADGPTRICHRCFARNPWLSEQRAQCHSPLTTQETLDEKLMWALGHPDTETAERAAAILARRGHRGAIPALARLVDGTDDPYRAAAAVRALTSFAGDPAADRALAAARRHASIVVRRALDSPPHRGQGT